MRRLQYFLILGAAALPAWAAEEGAGGPFAGNFGNALWTFLIFVLLLFVLGKYAWGPILSALQGREQFIHDSLAEAKKSRDDAAALLAEYEAKLAAARQEVEAILDEGRRDAAAVRLREEERAKQEAEKVLTRARREIEIAKDTAVKDLYQQAARLSTGIAQRILERELKPEDHTRLIDEAIASLEGRAH